MADVVLCPSCSTAYPVGDKPPGYRFECTCGAEVMKPEDAAPPPPEATVDRGAFLAMVWASVFVLPPVALLGAALGLGAWMRVRKNPGLAGGGFALSAVGLGLISTLWGSLAWVVLLR